MPHNVDTLIVKVASWCNLACTYCYEYSAGDETWRAASKTLSMSNTELLGKRIAEYARQSKLRTINVVAHGGEPLLMGPYKLDKFFSTLRETASNVHINFSIQTNAVLLQEKHCEVLNRHSVAVGVSLDGGPTHNSHRVDLKKRETWQRATQGIKTLKTYAPDRFRGILCVVDFQTEPSRVVQELALFSPPQIDFLQPFLTHDTAGENRLRLAMQFGRWMSRAMDAWLREPLYADIKIRVFEDAIRIAVGAPTKTDWFGPRTASYLVVDSNGEYDLLDQLKVIGALSAEVRSLGLSLATGTIQEAADRAEELLSHFKGSDMPRACSGCAYAKACSGSHLTSRYSQSNHFDNSSSYCEGLKMLFERAHDAIQTHRANA